MQSFFFFKSPDNRLEEDASSTLFVFVRLLMVDELLLAPVSCTLQDVMGSFFGIPWWFVWAVVGLDTRFVPGFVWDTVRLLSLTGDPLDRDVEPSPLKLMGCCFKFPLGYVWEVRDADIVVVGCCSEVAWETVDPLALRAAPTRLERVVALVLALPDLDTAGAK